MKVAFKMELKVKSSKTVFKEGMGPGVLESRIVEFEVPENGDPDVRVCASLLDLEHDMVDRNVEVVIKQVE